VYPGFLSARGFRVLPADCQLISVDDHVVEPPTVWVDRLPRHLKEVGPHIVRSATGAEIWEWEGRRYPVSLMGSPRTRIFKGDGRGDEFRSQSYDEMIPACYDAAERVKAMDEDGITASLNFPTFPRFSGTLFLQADDRELALFCVQAYNDWMIDEWCGEHPGRFIPMIIAPLWDPAKAAVEMERCAAKGARAVSVCENPSPLGLPSYWTQHWDPLFKAANETGLVLCMHIGTSGSLVVPSPESTEAVPISLCGLNAMSACADLIYSGKLQENPRLRVALSEGGSGWVPYLLERMDYTWNRTRIDVRKDIAPSELFQRHFWTCFISDDTAIETRHMIGVDRLMWECDFPHNDSEWPNSRNTLAVSLTEVPDDEARQIGELNARRVFDFF
jgi:predicted TIM-barrel fold metal-dependent hydrolase